MFLLFELKDLVIVPILILLIFFIAIKSTKNITDPYLKKTLYYGLAFKIFYSLLVVVLLNIYKSGDTQLYFEDTESLLSVIINNPEHTFSLLTNIYSDLSPDIQALFPPDYIFQTEGHNSGRVATFGVFPYLIFFKSYFGVNFAFSMFSFIASWKLFTSLIKLYPEAKKQMALVIFYIPSIVYWSCGYLKDPLSQGGLLFFIYAFIEIMYFKKRNASLFVLLIISARIIIIIKSYIFFLLLPICIFLFYQGLRTYNLKLGFKVFWNMLLLCLVLICVFFLIKDPNILGRFALDTILQEIQYQKESYETIDQGSFVSISQFDGSLMGLVQLIPNGLGLTFFRPFPWEANGALMLIVALENLITYYLVFKLFKTANFNLLIILKKIYSDKFIFLLLIYSLLLGAFIGISNPNFGTLSRYRIPAVIIFLLVIVITNSKIIALKNQKISLKK